MLKKVVSGVFDRKITLLSARPVMGKMAFTTEVIIEGLENNKKILILTLENDEDYFMMHLVSRLSYLKVKDVSKYYCPCRGSSKFNNEKIDRIKFVEALEYLQNSKLYINSNLCCKADIVDYIVEFNEEEKFDLIVINNLDLLVKKSKYLIGDIMKKLQKLNSVLIWNSVSRKVEGKKEVPGLNDINNYDDVSDFIDSNIVLYREIEDGCDIIKIVDYKSDMNIIVNYEKEFDRLKG